jgi:type IV secretion system protein VirD4
MTNFLTSLWSVFSDGAHSFTDLFEKQKGFSATFGKETSIASRFNKGLLISKHRKLTRRKSYENILLAGPTGSGKTTRLLYKMLTELQGVSCIVNDPSKELYMLSSGYLSQSYEIKTLNFSNSVESCGFNILSRIKKPSDVNKIANLLVASSLDKGGNSDPFWSLQSKTLLSILIRLLMHQPKEYLNMANVLFTLNIFASSPKQVDIWIAKTKDPKLILDYKSLIATPEKTLQNIVASCKAALQAFDDPEICTVTSHDSIDFDALRKKPTIIFLHNAVSDMKYINMLNGIFFEQLYGHILQKLPDQDDLDLFIFLEEASSLYIPVLPSAISNTRKHRTSNIICVQSPQQLATFYKEDATNISSNCLTKIFLPGITAMETLREIETLSGKCIYKDNKGTERVKPLISTDEIRLLPEDRTLILSGNKPLIKGRTSPFFKSRKYRRYSEIPPVPLQGDIPEEPLLLLGQKPTEDEK